MTFDFGKNLAEYRRKCGMTQVQLAQRISVTPQAVSKWENGGMPDSDLLPKISQVLGVSIDVLFGLAEEREEPDLPRMISWKIHTTPENERADVVMELLYAILGGYTEYQRSKVHYPENLELETYAELRTDKEMAIARLNDDLKYCFFLKIPEQGLHPYIDNTDMMVRLFETLADADAIRLICYLGSGYRNRMRSLEFIAAGCGLPLDKVRHIMDRLDRLGVVWRVAVDDTPSFTNVSNIVYGYTNSTPLTFILTLAKSLTQYIRFHDCNIDTWNHGPFQIPAETTDTPVPQAGLWDDVNK